MSSWWRNALGSGRAPSEDQEAAITAPHTGRRTVNAGAGTGKTSTLALRALWLIESENVSADQIVVVTFTNKAAAEIGARVADTLDRAVENGARFHNGGRGIRCSTIHALANDIRREFAFDFGFEAPPVGISDGEAHAIFHTAFKRFLNDELRVDASSFPLAESKPQLLERDLGKLALELKNRGISPREFQRAALAAAGAFGVQPWGQLYDVGTNGKGRYGGNPKSGPVPADDLAQEAQRERANIAVVTALLTDFDERLRACGAITYGDLISETTALLQGRPDIVKLLRKRWRYVLLDESQDTSDLQLAFLDTLFGRPDEADAAGLMPVGDFRQAIYGFNGASEDVMERLRQVGERELPLDNNRRSFQEIVDAAHAVLAEAKIVNDGHMLKAHKGSGTLECVRLENFGEDGQTLKERVTAEGKAIATEIARLLDDGQAQPSDIAILVRRRTHAAAYLRELNRVGISAALDRRSGLLVADEIRDLLAWMAWILDVHDSLSAVRVLQSPLCGLSDASTIELASSKAWLETFLTPASKEAEGRLSAHDLDDDTSARLKRVRALLVSLLPTASLPLTAAVERIMTELPLAASYVALAEREGAPTMGPQAIVNLASFQVLAHEFADDHPGARLRDFIEDIDRRILYDDDVQEAQLDLDGVRILTIHQAKGLEWPYVFVACSTKNQYGISGPTDRVAIYDVASGAFALKHGVDGRETFHWHCLKDEHDRSDGRRLGKQGPRSVAAEREQARVFYVALTRAKECVYVTAPASVKGHNSEATFLASIRKWALKQNENVDLRFFANKAVANAPALRALGTPLTVAQQHVPFDPASAGFRPRISFTAMSAFETCARQARYRYRLKVPDLREQRLRFVGFDDNDTPQVTSAARRGSLVHRALELWGRAKIDGRPKPFGNAFEDALLEFADVTDAAANEARANGERAVEALAQYELLDVEATFELAVAETTVTGAVDLIARDPARRLVVIDYKTGRTAGETYALQLALYGRVAEQRYPGERAGAVILRLTREDATFESASPLEAGEMERSVAAIDEFKSDLPNVGGWCNRCVYQGTPCREGAEAKVAGTDGGVQQAPRSA